MFEPLKKSVENLINTVYWIILNPKQTSSAMVHILCFVINFFKLIPDMYERNICVEYILII